jgi:hypothetical protein
MKLSKKEFEEEFIKNNKELEELYEPNDDFGGDKPKANGHIEITTSTTKSFDDKSDYEEDLPIDSDKYGANTKNRYKDINIPFGANMGNPYVKEMVELDEAGRERMLKMIRELLQNKSNDRDIVDRSDNSDINDNNIPDIDEINEETVITSLNSFADALIDKKDALEGVDMGVVLNSLFERLKNGGVNFTKIPSNIKNNIKRNL